MMLRNEKGQFVNGNLPWNTGTNEAVSPKSVEVLLNYTKQNGSARKGKIGVRGEKHYNWKGGITSLSNGIKALGKYKEWRMKVFMRDYWTCQFCGNKIQKIEAHHKKPFAQIMKENNIKSYEDAMNCDELWDINNGVTLCLVCHNLTKGVKNGL